MSCIYASIRSSQLRHRGHKNVYFPLQLGNALRENLNKS